jgi:hypothetical protein
MTPAAYDLADRLFQLAPWKWMDETLLIAIEEPESGRRDHISIMGAEGSHHALAIYLGPVARQRFNLIQADRDAPPEDMIALILGTAQLQCAFDERAMLYKSELAAIKQAGKKYRGASWPTFRVFRAGRSPAPADAKQTQWLCTAIEQVLEVAPTLRLAGESVRFGHGRAEILTRRFLNGEWRTDWTPDDTSLFALPQPTPDGILVEKVNGHRNAIPLEVAFLMSTHPVGRSLETSIFPFVLLVVEPVRGLVLGHELLSVEDQTYDQLIDSVPTALLRICDRNKIRPAAIAVESPATHALLTPTAAALGIRCGLQRRLPALREALDSLMRFMGGRGL